MNYNVPTMLTISATAIRSGLAKHYLRKLCIENKIVYVKCGTKYIINFEKLIEYLNKGIFINVGENICEKV